MVADGHSDDFREEIPVTDPGGGSVSMANDSLLGHISTDPKGIVISR
jgi:hypothetical protein